MLPRIGLAFVLVINRLGGLSHGRNRDGEASEAGLHGPTANCLELAASALHQRLLSTISATVSICVRLKLSTLTEVIEVTAPATREVDEDSAQIITNALCS